MKCSLLSLLKSTAVAIIFATSSFAWAEKDECTAHTQPHKPDVKEYFSDKDNKTYTNLCKIDVLKLHPTQFAVGMYEVKKKMKKLEDLASKDGEDGVKAFLNANPEPVVIGRDGQLYIIDHHHLGRSVSEFQKAHPQVIKNVYVIVLENHKKDSGGLNEFWNYMNEKAWVYLYDEHGTKRSVSDLKNVPSVEQLADDPFRTIAGETRCKEGRTCNDGQWMKKTNDVPFIEFRWAEHFRKMKTFEALTLGEPLTSKNILGYLDIAKKEIKEREGKLP